MEQAPGRRYFVTMAVDRYQHLPENAQLARPRADAERLGALLAASNYQHALPGLGEYSTAEHTKSSLSGWSKDVDLGAEDVVVFYYAGHGIVAERDRHYLMCWSSDEDDPAASALATEDLIRILTRTGLRNLLVVLDTCYGGSGAADGAQLVLRTLARRFDDTGSSGVWLLSSARARDEAEDGAFVDCLLGGLAEVHERTGQRQRFLDLSYVVEAVNRLFRQRGLRQRAELAAGVVTGIAPFLENRSYHPGLPGGDTDLASQRRWAGGELRDHFGPRARGVEYDFEPGLYFSGRKQLLAELIDWLNGRDDDRGRVVTGSPGCGKSAVLGRIVAMSDPTYRKRLVHEPDAAGTEITPGLVDVWIHARHKLLDHVVERIAGDLDLAAGSPGQLLRSISQRVSEHGPVVIVVDALDEAGAGADSGGKHEPRRIARELLRPLAGVPGVRLLVGTRRELVNSLGTSMTVLDLDDARYRGDDDVAGYVTKLLLAEDEPEVKTPYRGHTELAGQVGAAVSARASGLFLVARMTARGLRDLDTPVDVTEPGWQQSLPSDIGQAFEDYLDRYGPHRTRVRALLTPLAFAEGQGLPRGALWTNVASRLSGRDFTEDDLDWLLDEAEDYISEVSDNNGHSVYRLYHQSLAEHLRATYRQGTVEAQRRIVDAVLPTVTRGPDGVLDWFSAHRYLRAHLATHAAAGGRLNELAEQPSFLLVAEQLALLKAFANGGSESGAAVRSAYEQAAHQLMESVPLSERAAYLQLSARRCGAGELADQIDQLGIAMPWQTRWAWWSPTSAHRQIIGHDNGISAVATGQLDGRPVAVTGALDGTARIWDLITRRQLGDPLAPGSEYVTAVAMGELGEYSIVVTGGDDGRLCVWDLSTGGLLGAPIVGHTNEIAAIALDSAQGTTVAVSASRDGTARVWTLGVDGGVQQGEPFVAHRSPVHAVSLAMLGDRRIVLSGGADNRVRVWDLFTHEQLGELIGHVQSVSAVATHNDLVVTGSKDGTIGLWDLGSRQQIGEPMAAHSGGVQALAVGELDGVLAAVSCGPGSVRIWNLHSRRQLGQPLAGHARVTTVAFGTVDRTPVVITGGYDRTARIWDLTADRPLGGHTDRVVSAAIGYSGGRCRAVTGSLDASAVVWELSDSGARQDGPALADHRTTVTAVAMGEVNGRPAVITGTEGALVHIWDMASREALAPVFSGHTGPVTALELVAVDGRQLLFTGSRDGTVRIWDPATGEGVGEPLVGHNADVEQLLVSEVSGRFLVFAATRHITGWDLYSGKLDLEPLDPNHRVLALGFVDGRPVAIFSTADNSVLRWDILSGAPIGEPMAGHTDAMESAVVGNRNGHPVALTSSRDQTIRTWDLRTGTSVGEPLARVEYGDSAMTIGPMGGDTAAITLDRRNARLWSLRTFQQVGEPLWGMGMDTEALATGTVDKQPVIICGCDDGSVRVRELESGRPAGPVLNGHELWMMGCAITEYNGPIAVTLGAFDGTVRVWDLATYRERFRWICSEGARIYVASSGGLALYECDGRIFVATATKAAVRIWDLESRSLQGELTGHTGTVNDVAVVSRNGTPMVLTGSGDSTARIWDGRSFAPVCGPLTGHSGSVCSVAFGEIDHQQVAFTGDSAGAVRAWDPVTGGLLDLHIPEGADWVTRLTWGHLRGDPTLAIGTANGAVRLWSAVTREIVGEVRLHTTPQDLVIHLDHLCVATSNGVVALRFQAGR